MGRCEQIKGLKGGDFRGLTGVKLKAFEKMAEALRGAFAEKKRRGGRPDKLCAEDMLLMALEHLRECRAYSHRCKSCGPSEPNAYKGTKRVEGALPRARRSRSRGAKRCQRAARNMKLF